MYQIDRENLERARRIRADAHAVGRLLTDRELAEIQRLEGHTLPSWERQALKDTKHPGAIYYGPVKPLPKAAATDELRVYDVIDPVFGISAKQVLAQLDHLSGPLTVRINSPGGSVDEGVAIYNALRRYNQEKGKVTVAIDGTAASIASVIAMAGSRIVIAENAMLMIHQPWTVAAGNAGEFRRMADLLEKTETGQLIPAYTQQTGKSDREIGKLLQAETWFTSGEALEQGFVDEIGDAVTDAPATVTEAQSRRTTAMTQLAAQHRQRAEHALAAKAASVKKP